MLGISVRARAASAVLLLAVFLLSSIPVATAQPLPIDLHPQDAVLDFPEGITFGLDIDSAEPVSRVELRYAVEGNETLLLSIADVDRDNPAHLEHFVDLVVNYLPPGLTIEYFWRVFDGDGNATDSELHQVFWFDDRFTWTDYAGQDVTIYSYSGDDTFNRHVLDVAQNTADELQTEFGLEQVDHFAFWLYQSQSDFAAALAPNSQEWIGGITMPKYPTILATLAAGDEYELGRMISHEVTHQILYQAVRNPFSYISNWLDEGLAVSEQQTGTNGMEQQVDVAFQNGSLPTVQTLTSEWSADPATVSLSYASSYSLVQFLLSEFGTDGIARIVAGYAEGMAHDEALKNAIGLDTAGLNEAWRAALQLRQ